MRLSKRVIEAIKKSVLESFGSVDVYLFGSRVDDSSRGGDIDLAIDTKLSKSEFRKKKVEFIIAMMKQNLDLKIDLVKLNNSDALLTRQIKNSANKL